MDETVDGGDLPTVGMRSVVAWFAQYQCTKCGQVPTSLVRLWNGHWSWWRTSSSLRSSQFTHMFYDNFKSFRCFVLFRVVSSLHLAGSTILPPMWRIIASTPSTWCSWGHTKQGLSNVKSFEEFRTSKAPSLPSRVLQPGWMIASFCCQEMV